MELEKYVLDDLLKNIIKTDEDGNKYIIESEYNKLELTHEEKVFIKITLEKNNIKLRNEQLDKDDDNITREDRSPYVRDFEYGEQKTFETRKNDIPVKLKIDYEDELEFVENADELEYFLENDFIPNNVVMKQKKNKETGEVELFPSIQLNEITKLKYSEAEVEHIMNYLKEKNIRVCGYSQSLDSEFENYDYYRTYKNSLLPDSLSADEIISKFELWKMTNDPVIKEQIIIGNMRLVPYIAYSIAIYYGVNQKELEQYGYMYLIEAVDRFDHTTGNKFSTYAVPYIRGKLKTAVLEMLGIERANFSFHYLRAKKVVEETNCIKLYDNPEYIEDVVDILIAQGVISQNTRESYIRRFQLLNANSTEVLLDDNVDFVSNYDVSEDAIFSLLSDDIQNILSTLSDRERKILILRFGLDVGQGRTLEEVAQVLNVSRERIRQIEMKALRKLRHPSRNQKIRVFLEGDTDYMNHTELLLDQPLQVVDYDDDDRERKQI